MNMILKTSNLLGDEGELQANENLEQLFMKVVKKQPQGGVNAVLILTLMWFNNWEGRKNYE
ncbi:Uncharacterised protein [uncultured Roseburia sp.]|uniref:Uncharacterized protein n=1 Tax=Brotonthovivens ammoniilytica TaxID=2981725 RepID=A0ABT2TK39_9FIRM|nr:hypothetical protein [Brotonthovivens ammoniilytica]MCU6762046.1 hypothetical protein [Brotonthovivens ammoniilytica]SCI53966.1 Uncharacterised protein [uncultured Roseburia sp.]